MESNATHSSSRYVTLHALWLLEMSVFAHSKYYFLLSSLAFLLLLDARASKRKTSTGEQKGISLRQKWREKVEREVFVCWLTVFDVPISIEFSEARCVRRFLLLRLRFSPQRGKQSNILSQPTELIKFIYEAGAHHLFVGRIIAFECGDRKRTSAAGQPIASSAAATKGRHCRVN